MRNGSLISGVNRQQWEGDEPAPPGYQLEVGVKVHIRLDQHVTRVTVLAGFPIYAATKAP